jgi:DegV family protein with EDD domain
MIGLCTDSNSQLPETLRERYGICVVPLTVTVDGEEHLEGVDLDADAFWERFRGGHSPEVATSQPSPGQFALAYEELVAAGATEILSIHIGAGVSGTINSARLAAHNAAVPVRLVDSRTASFGISCCVWAAAEALAGGATLDEAAAIAEQLAPRVGNVFVVGALDLLRAGGRAGDTSALHGSGVPVLTFADGQVVPVARVEDAAAAVSAMADFVLGWDEGELNVAVGLADSDGAALSDALAEVLRLSPRVREVVAYRVGPSVGAHTGPGTAGAFMFPAAAVNVAD